MKQHSYWVYILASRRNGTLYVGMTNDLFRRISEHKAKEIKGFTAQYNVDKLVWHKEYKYVNEAIAEEKRLKKFYRKEKLALIEDTNPDWRDLFEDFYK
jgi:putative endonuclease